LPEGSLCVFVMLMCARGVVYVLVVLVVLVSVRFVTMCGVVVAE
jgi:hypothetical protein